MKLVLFVVLALLALLAVVGEALMAISRGVSAPVVAFFESASSLLAGSWDAPLVVNLAAAPASADVTNRLLSYPGSTPTSLLVSVALGAKGAIARLNSYVRPALTAQLGLGAHAGGNLAGAYRAA